MINKLNLDLTAKSVSEAFQVSHERNAELKKITVQCTEKFIENNTFSERTIPSILNEITTKVNSYEELVMVTYVLGKSTGTYEALKNNPLTKLLENLIQK